MHDIAERVLTDGDWGGPDDAAQLFYAAKDAFERLAADGAERDWERYAREFEDLGLDDVIYRLRQNAEVFGMDPGEIVAAFGESDPNELSAYYEQVAGARQGGEGDGSPEQEFDQAAWEQLLGQASAWWDGAEETWQQFVDYFVYQGTELGIAQAAQDLVDFVVNSGDKVEALRQYGVDVQANPQ
jgi:hypothetical protein